MVVAMSVELRILIEGECTCGIPHHIDEEPFPIHWHHIECDWGRIEHTDPNPSRGEIGPLMITDADYLRLLLGDGPRERLRKAPGQPAAEWPSPGVWVTEWHSATVDGDRLFVHVSYQDQRWTWELFEAHWWDRLPSEIMVGRWPD